jgi:hypothetical protein
MAKKSQNLFFLPFFENNSSDYENSPKNIIITINGLWVEKNELSLGEYLIATLLFNLIY